MRFFKPDKYVDRGARAYWTKLTYPFWRTDIPSALDSLWLIGFAKDDAQIREDSEWLVACQQESGLWRSGFAKAQDRDAHLCVSLAAYRVLKRFYGCGNSLHTPPRTPLGQNTTCRGGRHRPCVRRRVRLVTRARRD